MFRRVCALLALMVVPGVAALAGGVEYNAYLEKGEVWVKVINGSAVDIDLQSVTVRFYDRSGSLLTKEALPCTSGCTIATGAEQHYGPVTPPAAATDYEVTDVLYQDRVAAAVEYDDYVDKEGKIWVTVTNRTAADIQVTKVTLEFFDAGGARLTDESIDCTARCTVIAGGARDFGPLDVPLRAATYNVSAVKYTSE